MKVSIRGRRWNFVFMKLKGCLGNCEAPTSPNKTIRVDPTHGEYTTLSTIIHEVTHAATWDMSEEYVEEFSEDLARILWRLGYRRLSGED